MNYGRLVVGCRLLNKVHGENFLHTVRIGMLICDTFVQCMMMQMKGEHYADAKLTKTYLYTCAVKGCKAYIVFIFYVGELRRQITHILHSNDLILLVILLWCLGLGPRFSQCR